jgi:DNA modification methylase
MKITINTEDGSGLGTVSVNFEGLFVTDDGGELMIFLKRLMDMEDLCNEDRIKGNAAELLLVKGKKEKDAGKRVPILDEDNIEFSVKNQDQTDVWEGFSMNSFTQREKESIDGIEHPTIKPIKMLMDFIVNSSKMGDIILDTFSGSGSTIMAAEKTRRTCYAMELDPRYVDVALRRYAKYTGQEPVREADGKKWSEL